MPFHSEQNKHQGDSFWTSYSDLFLGLSAIFLLLYVVGSVRSGTGALKQQIDNEQLKIKVADLENQIKFYEQSKEEYLNKSANTDELTEYQELMDKLTLLQEDVKDENAKLRQQVLANNSKEKSLNKYQQMIRNVINSSKFEKIKVANRDSVIEENVAEIGTQKLAIEDLKKNISSKEQDLIENMKQINEVSANLKNKENELAKALKQQKISKTKYAEKLNAIKNESAQQISALEEKGINQKKELAQLSDQIGSMNNKIQGMNSEIQGISSALTNTQDKLVAKTGELNSTKGELTATKGELAKAQAEIEARKSVAQNIKNIFAKKGIKAEIDMDSGEVSLDFGKNYFDTNSANLKLEMKQVIDEAFPAYVQALLGDPKLAKKVSTVEIVGFASPTYKGRFIDPKSSTVADQEALKYNMDLSYQRAKSIFNYVLNAAPGKIAKQKEIIPLLKVSGRSFLESSSVNKNVSNSDFCKINDCKKAQRVVIRFNIEQAKSQERTK